jgi:HK97 family phage prohead protease
MDQHLYDRKSLPAFECKGYDPKTRRFTAIATKEIVDRDEEIVRVGAFEKRLDSFRKNPVLCYNHDTLNRPPIGMVVEIGIKGDEMPFIGELAPDVDSKGNVIPFQQAVNAAVEGGYLRAFSIQYRVFKFEPGGVDSNGKKARRTVVDAELLEVSLVHVGANDESVMKMANLFRVITGNGLETPEKVRVIFGTPSDLDVLVKARQIIGRLDSDQRKGLGLPEDLAREAEALALDLWTRGEEKTQERAALKALDGLLTTLK